MNWLEFVLVGMAHPSHRRPCRFSKFSVNIATAIFFLFSGQIVWPVVGVMAVGSLVGGTLGGRLAGRIPPAALRKIVVIIGVIVAAIYLVKNQH